MGTPGDTKLGAPVGELPATSGALAGRRVRRFDGGAMSSCPRTSRAACLEACVMSAMLLPGSRSPRECSRGTSASDSAFLGGGTVVKRPRWPGLSRRDSDFFLKKTPEGVFGVGGWHHVQPARGDGCRPEVIAGTLGGRGAPQHRPPRLQSSRHEPLSHSNNTAYEALRFTQSIPAEEPRRCSGRRRDAAVVAQRVLLLPAGMAQAKILRRAYAEGSFPGGPAIGQLPWSFREPVPKSSSLVTLLVSLP